MLKTLPAFGLVLTLAALTLVACARPYPPYPGPIGPPPPSAPNPHKVTPPPPPIDTIRPRIP